MITSLLLAVRVCELVLIVQEQYEQVPVLPRHPWVARPIAIVSIGKVPFSLMHYGKYSTRGVVSGK